MKQFVPIDPEDTPPELQRPIDTYPGYLGTIYDGYEMSLSPPLECLRNFDWLAYRRLSEDVDLDEGLGSDTKAFEPGRPSEILGQLPSIELFRDEVSDQGLAGASIVLIFVAEGYTEEDAMLQALTLRASLETHLNSLQAVTPRN
jgi:hypothetical protein